MVYQRSKGILAARPLGTVLDTYAEDYSWLNHSVQPTHIDNKDFRVRVGKGKTPMIVQFLISLEHHLAMSPPAIQGFKYGGKIRWICPQYW